MKILFITNNHKLFPAIIGYFPLGIMQLAGALKERGHKVYYSGLVLKNILYLIRENPIDVIAYSVMAGDEPEYLSLNQEIKKHFSDIFSVFGGTYPTFSPDIIEGAAINAVCRGEGIVAFVELIEKLSKGEDIRFLKNFWVNDGKKIYKNDLRPLLENISDVSFPDYDGYFDFVPDVGKSKKKIFLSSLGCPFDCTYCLNSAFNEIYKNKGRIYRNKNVDSLLGELFYVKSKYPLNWVNFVDDVFGLSRDWLVEFSEKYPREIGLPFSSIVRLELVDEHYLKLLVKSGCQSILVGIEAGNELVRLDILNKNMTNAFIIEKVALIKKFGLNLMTFNIIGIPPGSLNSEWETVHFNQKLRPNYAYASIFQPLPGTRLADVILKKEITEMKSPLELRNFHVKSSINLKNKNEIVNLHKFFSIVVAYPFLEPLVRVLLFFPFTFIYEIIRRGYGAFGFLQVYPSKKVGYSLKDFILGINGLLMKRSI